MKLYHAEGTVALKEENIEENLDLSKKVIGDNVTKEGDGIYSINFTGWSEDLPEKLNFALCGMTERGEVVCATKVISSVKDVQYNFLSRGAFCFADISLPVLFDEEIEKVVNFSEKDFDDIRHVLDNIGHMPTVTQGKYAKFLSFVNNDDDGDKKLAAKFVDEFNDFDNDVYEVADTFGHIGRMAPEELKTANEVIRGLCGWSLDTLADMAKKVNLDDYDLF